ncbi:MAG: hypothetical protein IPM42_20150 [Saprospiraceae bacterium]|nr:hypothetical protein [Saprospiraceae bacterium]
MKKLFIVFAVVLLVLPDLSAQFGRKKIKEVYATRYGIKIAAGPVLATPELTLVGNESDFVVHEVKFRSSRLMHSYGLFAQKKAGYLFGQADLLYSNYGMSFDVLSFSSDEIPGRIMSENFHYADLQILGGLTGNGFRIGVGPVVHILAGHNTELDQLEQYVEKLRKVSFGFSGMIGYEVGAFTFDLKYENAFRTLGDHVWYGNRKSRFIQTPNSLTLSVAVALIR